MTESSEVPRLLAHARRRAVSNLVWAQVTIGAAAALAGAIVLLLVGTSILDWYWLAVLFAAGFGISAWRTWRRVPSSYEVAQQVDRRLGLNDALSTALHFQTAPAQRADATIVQAQRADAEAIASRIAAAAAWPYALPRQTYHAAALLAVVLALGIFRYGTQGTLDFRAPMIRAVTDFFWTGEQQQASAKKKMGPRAPGEDPLGIALDQPDPQNFGEQPLPDDLLSVTDTPQFDESSMAKYSGKTDEKSLKAAGEQGDSQDSEESDGSDSEGAGDQSDAPGQQPSNEGANAKQSSNEGGKENSSLIDKMRDAMSNLLSKLNVQQPMTKSNEAPSGQEKQAKGGSGQKGEKSSGKKQGKGSPSDDGESSQEGQGQQQADAGQGKSSDNAGDSPSKDPNSGVGKQDGDKSLRDAEQLAAMGKISEIFGKRAQNVSGEIMIEVNSGKQQQLRTAYSTSGANHREAGSEIHRDEVPLVYQHYVQKYFETVRSQTPAAAAPKP